MQGKKDRKKEFTNFKSIFDYYHFQNESFYDFTWQKPDPNFQINPDEVLFDGNLYNSIHLKTCNYYILLKNKLVKFSVI